MAPLSKLVTSLGAEIKWCSDSEKREIRTLLRRRRTIMIMITITGKLKLLLRILENKQKRKGK